MLEVELCTWESRIYVSCSCSMILWSRQQSGSELSMTLGVRNHRSTTYEMLSSLSIKRKSLGSPNDIDYDLATPSCSCWWARSQVKDTGQKNHERMAGVQEVTGSFSSDKEGLSDNKWLTSSLEEKGWWQREVPMSVQKEQTRAKRCSLLWIRERKMYVILKMWDLWDLVQRVKRLLCSNILGKLTANQN